MVCRRPHGRAPCETPRHELGVSCCALVCPPGSETSWLRSLGFVAVVRETVGFGVLLLGGGYFGAWGHCLGSGRCGGGRPPSRTRPRPRYRGSGPGTTGGSRSPRRSGLPRRCLPPGPCHAPRCCVTVAYLKQPAPRSGAPPTALFAGSPTLRPVWSAPPPGCPPSVHVRNTAPYSFGPVSGHAAPVPGGWRRIMAGGARSGALRTSTGRAAPSPPSRQPDALHQDFQ